MPRETILTAAAARLARLPFWLFARRAFTQPQKALILKPCCVSQAMLTTPLLAALRKAHPNTRFDWAISDWARSAVAGNPRITELISTGRGGLDQSSWADIHALIERLRQEQYDTCFIPSRSSWLAYIAWRAGIPQRIGLHVNGRGFAHTLAVKPPSGEQHEALVYQSLALAAGVDAETAAASGMEYYAPDIDRTAVTRRLVDELDWLGDVPLVIMHPGGGTNPVRSNTQKQWPVERYARLGNHLTRKYEAKILLIGATEERPLAKAISGMMSATVANWAGYVKLGEVGALSEVADLYVGNDAGPTHIAAAVGCPTLAIFGPSNPAVSGPYATKGPVTTLWGKTDKPFAWDNGVTVAEATDAADKLLARLDQKR
ncbi:MAG: glycosyltransferase family 9 protein [Chloroflexi bacterium]|nr:glycosyltransferase family 9 protein [Chloroflexota bacterium]